MKKSETLIDPMDISTLNHRAQHLVKELADGCDRDDLGSATVSIYDTAWLSMIVKSIDGRDHWLFPASFQFLLDSQLSDGSWDSHTSPNDGILNTMTALLAIKKHSKNQLPENKTLRLDLDVRISKAKRSLEEKLCRWDVEAGLNVGFEILVPAILTMLEDENLCLHFPGRPSLQRMREKKMLKFDSQRLYDMPSSFLHSLEAFIGLIDFDRLGHHKTHGSMMGSPASTAAYLMYSSRWDDEAEAYLAKVIVKGQGKGGGGVPSVFPMPFFEITWVWSRCAKSIRRLLTGFEGSFHSIPSQLFCRINGRAVSGQGYNISRKPLYRPRGPSRVWSVSIMP